MNTEPTRIGGYVTLLITTALALFVAYGGNVSQEQREAILGFVGALVIIFPIMIEFIRSKVFAPATVERIETEAAITGQITPDLTPPAGD